METQQTQLQASEAILQRMKPSTTRETLLAVQQTLERNAKLVATLSRKDHGLSPTDVATALHEFDVNVANIVRLQQLDKNANATGAGSSALIS